MLACGLQEAHQAIGKRTWSGARTGVGSSHKFSPPTRALWPAPVVRQIRAQLKAGAHVLRSIVVREESEGALLPKFTRSVMVEATWLIQTPSPCSLGGASVSCYALGALDGERPRMWIVLLQIEKVVSRK